MYKLLIAVATDSSENFSLYSGYVWLPKEVKWKLIGTCKIEGRWNTLQSPATFFNPKERKYTGKFRAGMVPAKYRFLEEYES